MSLLSLLIALAAERSLSTSAWRFDYYYQRYVNFFQNNAQLTKIKNNTFGYTIFLVLPVALTYAILAFADDGIIHLVLSTLILIVCFGCFTTRDSYKHYLHSAFRGESSTTDFYHQQLLQDKNLPQMGFGQALIWLNYRYYIAVMIFFTLFGATGVVFYRLLTSIIEQKKSCLDITKNSDEHCELQEEAIENNNYKEPPSISSGCKNYHDVLFWIDWIPVRITSFGYMLVGHFSKALPVWLENISNINRPTYQVLVDVAEKSEDIMIDNEDCTAEPCLLVRLAKRTVLLVFAVISMLTLTGIIN